ncbi:MAG: alpha-L-fucosidase [Bacteroidota bacterium]
MKTKILITSLSLLLFAKSILPQQIINKNFVLISPTDTKEDIISKAANITPTPQQYDWQKMEYIAFLHFGINTFTNREWGVGNEDPKIFNPEKFDAGQWAKALNDAGMKMAILTAKHHDGFCLWPSNFTEHSVKNSAWKNGKGDVVREFTDACRKYGLKVGLYLSPWDRNNPLYGDSPKYNEFYLNQLRELLTNYGEISEVWFDGACGEGPNGKKQIYDWRSYYKLIRELQPNAVIFGMSPDLRWVGTETGYGRETEWNVIPIDLSNANIKNQYPLDEIYSPHDYVDYNLGSRQKLYEAKGLFWYPAEADVSIRPGWFYHKSQDDSVKSIKQLFDIYFGSVGRNCVLLLNIPPDRNGLICQNDIDTIKALKNIIDKTFNRNLAEGSKVVVDEDKSEVSYESFFQENNSLEDRENITLNFMLTAEVNFDVVLLQEDIMTGQRIEKFHLEYWNSKEWIKFTEGTTVGYKRLLRFNPVKTNKVRLTIEQSRANPILANFGLFKMSQ